jgi:hypothetical protein
MDTPKDMVEAIHIQNFIETPPVKAGRVTYSFFIKKEVVEFKPAIMRVLKRRRIFLGQLTTQNPQLNLIFGG